MFILRMKFNKVLVFDRCRFFSRFLKYEFKKISFTTCTAEQVVLGISDNEKFDLVVFVLYDEEDLICLFQLYLKGEKILVCNHSNIFFNNCNVMDNIEFLDCLTIRKFLKKTVHLFFD